MCGWVPRRPLRRRSSLPLRLGVLRACLHARPTCSGCPLVSLHPGASRWRSDYRGPLHLGVSLLRMSEASVSVDLGCSQQTPSKCPGIQFLGISTFFSVSRSGSLFDSGDRVTDSAGSRPGPDRSDGVARTAPGWARRSMLWRPSRRRSGFRPLGLLYLPYCGPNGPLSVRGWVIARRLVRIGEAANC